ncbi:hypothetical protein [Bosea rubneri]|uniref:Integrase n=1 Tax=Bosea rubneri TaxID=3075434 RepID=A0ABU3SBB1_9HYPH|nr:hypothetical protein [Bosea sp. ZW T0_25]MDU0342073.1 hypothetical protein [Bosea sp. ZW T0_25]
MAEIITFVPKANLDAATNMAAFVRLCREKLTVFGIDLDYDAAIWDVSSHYERRGHHHRLNLNFVEHRPRAGELGAPMPEPFAMQVKAYVRYNAGLKAKSTPPQHDVIAFRALLDAFKDMAVEPNLCSLDTHILDRAVMLANQRNPGNFAAEIGVCLARFSRFLREKQLALYAPIDWRHRLEWLDRTSRTSKIAAERREALLPSVDALRALPEAFRLAREPRDVIATSVVALLSCAPSRINEILTLRSDCVIEPLTENDDGCLLRWAGSKGHPDFAKAIPAVMADVAVEAVARLKKHTDEARAISLWYEENPGSVYLQSEYAHLRGADLTTDDISNIVGCRYGSDWAKINKVERIGSIQRARGGVEYIYSFIDVERAIMAHLPSGFPILDKKTGLRYSNSMMVVRRNEFARRRDFRWKCMISAVNYYNIQYGFYNVEDGILARLGLSSADQPIVFQSHQLRHYLNTIAQRGGLSEVEIAAWSGRRDIRQNAAYDHRTQEERLERKRQRDNELAAITGKRASINKPVSPAEVTGRSIHGHATELGFCEHDFAASPCLHFMECLHCTKQVCVKGADPRHRERVAFALERARKSLQDAEEALSKEYEGAQDWVDAHRATIDRLGQLAAILDDPGTPDGSVIRLAKSGQYSLVEQAMYDHQAATGALLHLKSDIRGTISGPASEQ